MANKQNKILMKNERIYLKLFDMIGKNDATKNYFTAWEDSLVST